MATVDKDESWRHAWPTMLPSDLARGRGTMNALADMQHRLWQAEDRVAGLEREQRAHMEQITALTAQRDRLLAYAQATAALLDAPSTERLEVAQSAWHALIAAGDITEDE